MNHFFKINSKFALSISWTGILEEFLIFNEPFKRQKQN